MFYLTFYILGICQSIGSLPKLVSISFILEKCLHPKNPLCADKGLGWERGEREERKRRRRERDNKKYKW